MISVWYDAVIGGLWVGFREDPFLPGSLAASAEGDVVTIRVTGSTGDPVSVAPYTGFARRGGLTGFSSAAEAVAYLQGEFARRPAVGETFGVPTIAAVALIQGQPVAVSRATGQLMPARADAYALAFVAGVASADTAAGFVDQPAHGAVTLSDWSAAADTAQLAPGLPYFLAPAGGLTAAPPGAGGLCNVRVGLAVSPTTLIVAPTLPIQL